MFDLIVRALGVIGLGSLVSAYIPTLFGKLKPDTYKFMIINWVGGFCLMLNGYLSGIDLVYPILNTIWTIGTTYQIARKMLKR